MKKKKTYKKVITKNIYIHNDIANAAFHLKKRIEKNYAAGEREGISLDIMSCLIMYAFEFEAKINFIGHIRINKWNERDAFDRKLKKINRGLELGFNRNYRPYATIDKLKKFRDSVAHGKPLNQKIRSIMSCFLMKLIEKSI